MFPELRSMGLTVVPATKRHAREVGRAMCASDRAEVYASGRMTPEQAARVSINLSPGAAWAVYLGPDLLCVFGIRTFPSGWDSPWLLSTSHLERYPFTFWRASRVVMGTLRSQHPQMVQMIYAKYKAALRWAKRLGFKVGSPEPFGPAKEFFCQVTLVTKAVICV